MPYINDTPWSTTNSLLSNFSSPFNTIGSLNFTVINELTHASEPIPDIYVNVWVSAGPDFQVSFPFSDNLVTDLGPVNPLENVVVPELQSSSIKRREPITIDSIREGEFEAQGLTQDNMRYGEHAPLLPNAHGCVEMGICNVDTVTHLKQLTNRPSFVNETFIRKDGSEASFINLHAVNDPLTDAKVCYVDWFQQIFMFTRGSLNVKLIPHVNAEDAGYSPFTIMANSILNTFSPDISIPVTGHSDAGMQVFSPSYNPSYEVNVPYYSNMFAVATGVVQAWFPRANANNVRLQNLPNTPPIGTGNYSAYGLYKSSGDDFSFSYLIGPPATFRDL